MNSKLIGEFNNKFHRTELQYKTVQSQNSLYQHRIDDQRKKLEKNKNDQKIHENFNQEHKQILENISKDRNQQQKILKDETKLLKELNEQRNLLQREKEQIDSEHAAVTIALNEQNRKKEMMENKHAQLKEHNRNLVNDNIFLQEEIDQKQRRIDMIQNQIASYKQEISDMRVTLIHENKDIIKPQSIAGSQFV